MGEALRERSTSVVPHHVEPKEIEQLQSASSLGIGKVQSVPRVKAVVLTDRNGRQVVSGRTTTRVPHNTRTLMDATGAINERVALGRVLILASL